jgi:hypothetical protein
MGCSMLLKCYATLRVLRGIAQHRRGQEQQSCNRVAEQRSYVLLARNRAPGFSLAPSDRPAAPWVCTPRRPARDDASQAECLDCACAAAISAGSTQPRSAPGKRDPLDPARRRSARAARPGEIARRSTTLARRPPGHPRGENRRGNRPLLQQTHDCHQKYPGWKSADAKMF